MNPQITTIESYVALNNPSEAARVLAELGAPPVQSSVDLINKLHFATQKFGAKAILKLAEIDTPYKRLILSEYDKEGKSNCSGCGGKCNFTGEDGGTWELPNQGSREVAVINPMPAPVHDPNTGFMHTSTNMLALTAVALLGVLTVAIIAKK